MHAKTQHSIIYSFKNIKKTDIPIAGGKGASLGEMTSAGIPVPSGFIIGASAFDQFLHETALFQDIQAQLDAVNFKDTNSVDRYSNVIRDMIAKTKFPRMLQGEVIRAFKTLHATYVAVRSSATSEDSKTASWAGELETYLNTTEKTLIGNVKKCWSSLFTPRAIFYRHEKKMLGSHISVAVVVQKMIQSEISGITFTVHPVTEDRNQMIIEAAYGLGEAIVSGALTPDSYVIDKRDLTLIDVNLAEQERMLARKGNAGGNVWRPVKKSLQNRQKLTVTKIKELACICLSIEKHYGHPQDIEWAWARGKFYITQSRPITTLKN